MSGERSARLEAVGVSVTRTPPTVRSMTLTDVARSADLATTGCPRSARNLCEGRSGPARAGEQRQAPRDGPRGPMPFSDRPLFLRTCRNAEIDRFGLHTRVRPSVRASRIARDCGWDGRRGKLGPLQLNTPFPTMNVANAQTAALKKKKNDHKSAA